MSDREIHLRSVAYATELKKAWLLAKIWGGEYSALPENDTYVPKYIHWDSRELRQQIKDLEDDVEAEARRLFLGWKKALTKKTAEWLSERWDAWKTHNEPTFCISRVIDLERAIGPLRFREVVECPPYAEILGQGTNSAFAIRHPEYHLARDLALYHSLYIDAEANVEAKIRNGKRASTEINQSLGRSVVLACYSLLDSFISGLATAWLLEHDRLTPDAIKTLSKSNGPLEQRFTKILSVILGTNDPLAGAKEDIELLFGDYIKRRNSYVHCEPDAEFSNSAIDKERRFHDINKSVVTDIVLRTNRFIKNVWFLVHGSVGPRWLADKNIEGRYDRIDVRLALINANRTESG